MTSRSSFVPPRPPSQPQSSSNTTSEDGKKDIGWLHSHLEDPNDPNSVTCDYCGHTSKGGIYRAKCHLVGGFKDVKKCKECPQSVREEVKAYMMEKRKEKRLKSTGGMKQHFEVFDLEDEEEYDDVDAMPLPSSKVGQKRGASASDASVKGKGSVEGFVIKKKAVGKMRQTSIKEVNKDLRDRTCQKIVRFFYQAGVAFNAARLDSFKEMIQAIGEYGPNMKPPSYHELRGPLLKKELEYTDELLKENREECEKHGCSIMSDGWTDRKGRTLINFMVNTAKGSVFVESVDASAHVKSGTLIYELLDKFVERVGEKNVVQVITDNGSNFKLAGSFLEAKRPNLFWTPCAAHCLDLMLEDIGKIPTIKATIAKAIALVGFIYNHGGVLSLMREFTGNKELARHGVTRFATCFLTLQSLHRHQKELKTMFLSQQWADGKWSKEAKGKSANETVFRHNFWNNVTYTLKVMCPLVHVLRIADNEKRPPMGYIYEAMDRAKESIVKSFENNPQSCQKVLDIIDARWENQLHHPLHAAGYYLNPYFYYHNSTVEDDVEVTQGLFKCISRLLPDRAKQDLIITKELPVYKNAEGLFGGEYAVRARDNEDHVMSPAEWWKMFGGGTPNLKEFAVKVLSLTCSASGCERNWSTFEHIHSKKRNKLLHKKLRDLVYVKYNQTLKARSSKKEKIDPLKLSNIDDCNNEWLVGVMDAGDEEVFGNGDGLTWNDVGEASGINEPMRSTRQTSNASGGGGSSSTSRGRGRGSGRSGRGGSGTTPSLRSLMLHDMESESSSEDEGVDVEVYREDEDEENGEDNFDDDDGRDLNDLDEEEWGLI